VRLAVDQIQWIESNGDYAFVYTQERRFVVHTSLKTIAQKLPTGRFLRVHRRYIVHLDSIQEIDQDTLVLAGRQFIPIGKAYRPALLQSVTVL
jgi:DNA-binding LytR/AlgR family response regulator